MSCEISLVIGFIYILLDCKGQNAKQARIKHKRNSYTAVNQLAHRDSVIGSTWLAAKTPGSRTRVFNTTCPLRTFSGRCKGFCAYTECAASLIWPLVGECQEAQYGVCSRKSFVFSVYVACLEGSLNSS